MTPYFRHNDLRTRSVGQQQPPGTTRPLHARRCAERRQGTPHSATSAALPGGKTRPRGLKRSWHQTLQLLRFEPQTPSTPRERPLGHLFTMLRHFSISSGPGSRAGQRETPGAASTPSHHPGWLGLVFNQKVHIAEPEQLPSTALSTSRTSLANQLETGSRLKK